MRKKATFHSIGGLLQLAPAGGSERPSHALSRRRYEVEYHLGRALGVWYLELTLFDALRDDLCQHGRHHGNQGGVRAIIKHDVFGAENCLEGRPCFPSGFDLHVPRQNMWKELRKCPTKAEFRPPCFAG